MGAARLTGAAALAELVQTGEVIFVPEVTTFEDVFEPSLKPPPIKTYSGRKVLKDQSSFYTVQMDAGAFRSLWEYVETEARHRFPSRGTLEGTAALLRALEAIRGAYWAENVPPAPEEPKAVITTKTRQVHKVGKTQSAAPAKKLPTKVNGVQPKAPVVVPKTRKIVRKPRASAS